MVTRQMLASATGADVGQFELNSDDATERFLRDPPKGAALIVTHYPRPELIDHITAHSLPVILAIDDPIACTAFHLHNIGGAVRDAIRPLTQSLSLIAAFAAVPGKTLIGVGDLGEAAATVAGRIADRIRADGASIAARALASLGISPATPLNGSIQAIVLHGASLQPLVDRFEPYEAGMIEQITGGIIDLCLGHPASEIVWHYEFFYDGGTFTSPAPMMIDLAGPARCIYYGPFLHLPTGRWDAKVFLGFSNEITETHVKVDIFTDEIQENFVGKVTRGGIYTMPLTFDVVDPRQPIQLRLFIDRGEIEGRIGLAMARLSPNQDDVREQDHSL